MGVNRGQWRSQAAKGNPSSGPYSGWSRRWRTASRPIGGVLYPVARAVAIHLRGLPGDIGRAARPLLGLAPGGACRADRVAPAAGALLPHRFTLACARHRAIGGLLSVALSCGSPRLAVSQHPALWSPDLPRHPVARDAATTRPARRPRPACHEVRVDRAPDR